ncbi:hypothetical protein C6571_18245 (plasmid) [Simplicispira suum]|uniref:Uncharacterized protein n=1 Tax=Simplicispira suum TaxID=2109915 RepID=A0A2S0N5W1_9BURK|nr:hypothetical protein C6571_18245 [Simplicispira suum]
MAYFAHVCGGLAVLLGVLRLNGYIPDSLVSELEAVFGVGIGTWTVWMGARALKVLGKNEGGGR